MAVTRRATGIWEASRHEAITSGYLAVERPSHEGWRHVETVTLDGWAADRFRRLR
jgi:hypothetical protein